MDFSEMVTEFVKVCKYSSYSAELSNFENAICAKYSKSIDLEILQRIRTSDIIESIEYLVDKRVYFTKSIALKFRSAIAQFFRYAIRNNWLSNSDFLREINSPHEDKKSYSYQVTMYIKKSDALAKPVKKEPLNNDEVIDLINYIDDYFNYSDLNQPQISQYAALLAMKLMLFTGIKYGVLLNIKCSDISLDINQIVVNGYRIRMPVLFTEQMRKYLSLRTEFTAGTLFIKDDYSSWTNTSSSGINYYLDQIMLRSDTTGLTKFGIQQLLLVGTDIPTIEKLTRAGKAIIYSCGGGQPVNVGRLITQTDVYYLC